MRIFMELTCWLAGSIHLLAGDQQDRPEHSELLPGRYDSSMMSEQKPQDLQHKGHDLVLRRHG
jgi:hypothetical protein